MIDTLYSQLGGIVLVLVCAFALWQGDEPERIGGSACFIAWLASLLLQDETNLTSPQGAIFTIDLMMFCVLAFLTWKTSRSWTVWATAFQLIGLCAHIAIYFDLKVGMRAYYTALSIVSYGVLISIAVGTFWVWQERRAREMSEPLDGR